jgi:hypothetical protein
LIVVTSLTNLELRKEDPRAGKRKKIEESDDEEDKNKVSVLNVYIVVE